MTPQERQLVRAAIDQRARLRRRSDEQLYRDVAVSLSGGADWKTRRYLKNKKYQLSLRRANGLEPTDETCRFYACVECGHVSNWNWALPKRHKEGCKHGAEQRTEYGDIGDTGHARAA